MSDRLPQVALHINLHESSWPILACGREREGGGGGGGIVS